MHYYLWRKFLGFGTITRLIHLLLTFIHLLLIFIHPCDLYSSLLCTCVCLFIILWRKFLGFDTITGFIHLLLTFIHLLFIFIHLLFIWLTSINHPYVCVCVYSSSCGDNSWVWELLLGVFTFIHLCARYSSRLCMCL